MGQQKLKEVKKDDMNKRPQVKKKSGIQVLDNVKTRRGEVLRAARRISDNVNAQASQHIIDVPTNRSVYNGFNGEQFNKDFAKKLAAANRNAKKSGEPTLKVIPVGGVGEMGIGKNMTAIEYGDEILVIDMGFLFPGEDYPGINYITPDISYLEEHKEKIKAVAITHGHLDHIGAFHHLIPKIPAPVYATQFTIGMLKKNMDEDSGDFEPEYHEMNPEKHDREQISEHFSIEFVRVNHSIPDSAAVVIRTPMGVIVSSGDWRFENEPVDGKKFDLDRMSEIAAKEHILLFMNESTNCEDAGSVTEYGENDIKVSFDQVMDKYPNSRMIISAFSSQIHRIQNIVRSASEHGRKVAFQGFSMIQNVELGLKTGQLTIPANTVVTIEDLMKLPDDQICVICTGSQGEFNAVLNRMASGQHRWVKLESNDVIVFSSNAIPGNENHVTHTVDGLMRLGSDVLQNRRVSHYGIGPLHLSGHAKRDDHIKLIEALNPTFYLPNHGEFHMLVHNAEIAEYECGIPRDHIFVCDAGDVIEFARDGEKITGAKTGRIKVGGIMYDDSGTEVSDVVLKDRIHMSTEGIFTVVITVQRGSGRMLSSPDIISRGFIYLRDSEELIGKIRSYVKQKTSQIYRGRRVDMESFKKDLRDEISQILYDETGRSPIVIPVVNEIGSFNNREAKKFDQKREQDEKDFQAQELARIRGGSHSNPRNSRKPQNSGPKKAMSFGGNLTQKDLAKNGSSELRPRNPYAGNIASVSTPKRNADEISFKKNTGPAPIKMWKD